MRGEVDYIPSTATFSKRIVGNGLIIKGFLPANALQPRLSHCCLFINSSSFDNVIPEGFFCNAKLLLFALRRHIVSVFIIS